MERVFDLPAHPLFVHAPLVLLPLTSLVAVAFMFLPTLRNKFRWPLAVASLIVFVFVLLAEQSGKAFDKATKGLTPVDEHAKLAEVTKFLTLGFVVLLFASIAVARKDRGFRLEDSPVDEVVETSKLRAPLLGTLFSVGTALVGVLATIWMIRTGHEGAKAVWTGTIK